MPVITDVLKAVSAQIVGAGAAELVLKPENIKLYADLLGAIAESIKTTSITGGSRSFSRNRIAPGIFAITSAKTMTIFDKDTFGEESITATSFIYGVYFSKQHTEYSVHWGKIMSLILIIRKLNEARINLVDQLMSN